MNKKKEKQNLIKVNMNLLISAFEEEMKKILKEWRDEEGNSKEKFNS